MTTQCDLTGPRVMEELRQFASFPRETQRYICRALEVAFLPASPAERWARDAEEAESIAVQKHVYGMLPTIGASVPREGQAMDADAFLFPLMEATAFDVSCGQILGFDHYCFLYERLLGGRIRPWLGTAFLAAAGLPYMPTEMRLALLGTAAEAVADHWPTREPAFWPQWIPDGDVMAA